MQCFRREIRLAATRTGPQRHTFDDEKTNALAKAACHMLEMDCAAAAMRTLVLSSRDVDGDDDKLASEADFDDDFGCCAVERDASDDRLDFSRLGVALAFDDFAREDDVFEIEDVEVVIFKFFGCVG